MNCTDKYLLDFLRLKIVDKAHLHQDKPSMTLHSTAVESLNLPATDEGYILLIEGIMPYNTTEG